MALGIVGSGTRLPCVADSADATAISHRPAPLLVHPHGHMGKTVTLDVGHRVFDNPILDWLSRTPPVLLWLWMPIALGAIAVGATKLAEFGATWHAAYLAPAGVLAWTLAEYVLHRWFFHWVPRNATLRRAVYYVHLVHHDYIERDRIIAPPLMSLPLFFFFLGVFALAFMLPMGEVGVWYMLPFLGGFVLGYMGYDYSHYITHFKASKSRWVKGVRRRHMQHHFAYPDCWYGVSSPLWDFVLGTNAKANTPKSKATSEAIIAARDGTGESVDPETGEPLSHTERAPVAATSAADATPHPEAPASCGAPCEPDPAEEAEATAASST